VDGSRVQDLIGLIMFKYTEQGRKPELKVDLIRHLILWQSTDTIVLIATQSSILITVLIDVLIIYISG
jgi:hypothetical protein